VIGVGWGLPSRASSLKLSIYGFKNSADSNALWSECFLATPGSHTCWSVRHHGLLIHLFIYLFIIFLLCRIAVHSIRCSLLLPMLRVLCVCVSICWSQWRNWQRCRLTQVRSRNHDPPRKRQWTMLGEFLARCNTHTHTQLFNGPFSRITRVGLYQKKHSPTHTCPIN